MNERYITPLRPPKGKGGGGKGGVCSNGGSESPQYRQQVAHVSHLVPKCTMIPCLPSHVNDQGRVMSVLGRPPSTGRATMRKDRYTEGWLGSTHRGF